MNFSTKCFTAVETLISCKDLIISPFWSSTSVLGFFFPFQNSSVSLNNFFKLEEINETFEITSSSELLKEELLSLFLLCLIFFLSLLFSFSMSFSLNVQFNN